MFIYCSKKWLAAFNGLNLLHEKSRYNNNCLASLRTTNARASSLPPAHQPVLNYPTLPHSFITPFTLLYFTSNNLLFWEHFFWSKKFTFANSPFRHSSAPTVSVVAGETDVVHYSAAIAPRDWQFVFRFSGSPSVGQKETKTISILQNFCKIFNL